MPLVTVLMPVYNGALYLGEAIDSILGQTAGDLELVIVDDGSTDGTAEILRGYRDPRLRLLQNPTNQGIVVSLNRGLDAAQGRYVARMDADDVSLPDRLEKQVRFMDEHPDVGVSAGGVQHFGRVAPAPFVPSSVSHEQLVSMMIFGNPLTHPTVMLRSELTRGGLRYDPGYPHAEDYELWTRCGTQSRLAKIPELLLRYRHHEDGVSTRYTRVQLESTQRIRLREVSALGMEATAEEAALHASLATRWFRPGEAYLGAARRWLEALAEANRQCRRLPEGPFEQVLGTQLLAAARHADDPGLWSATLTSPLIAALNLSPFHRARSGARRARSRQS